MRGFGVCEGVCETVLFPCMNRSLHFGVGRRGFVPICSDLRSLFSGFVPICSDLLRFLPICADLFSEQIRTNQGSPFLPTPFASPRMKCFDLWASEALVFFC